MKVKDIFNMINADFPFSNAFDGDNVGLIVGDGDAEVKKILLTCDVDEGVAAEAVRLGANLIVSHHPLMFYKTNRLTESDPEQRTVRTLIAGNISLISAHTNLDATHGGLNDYMAGLLGLRDTEVIQSISTDVRDGYGRAAKTAPITLKELMDKVIDTFSADGVRYCGEPETVIEKIGVNTGGGASVLFDAIGCGCDVLITGDVKYNGYRDAIERNMCVIDLMHYDSEHIVMDFFEGYFDGRLTDVEVVKSKANINVVRTYVKK